MNKQFNVIDPWSVDFIERLIGEFGIEVDNLLEARESRRNDSRGELGAVLGLPISDVVRDPLWRVASVPNDLVDRRVEITGPGIDARMVINALNSGASGYMIDGEDSLSPTWENVIKTQSNMYAAIRRTLVASKGGKQYCLNSKSKNLAVLHYRPRGLHLTEEGFKFRGKRAAACLVDVGLFLYFNAWELKHRGTGPYLYLPKLETECEARFWDRVLTWCENELKLPQDIIRVTVLVETLPGLIRIESIVWALRKRLTALNVGRWDYIFSCIKVNKDNEKYIFPDRSLISMECDALVEYARWVVHIAHRRGAHAIGGMSAQVPNRKDIKNVENVNFIVRKDKLREVGLGHDGTWVAHPDLVMVAKQAFDEVLCGRVEQRHEVPGSNHLNLRIVLGVIKGQKTLDGLREAARVVLRYIDTWLRGEGCVAIDGKMEDAATAEISRALMWQWVRGRVVLEDGFQCNEESVCGVIVGEAAALSAAEAEPSSDVVQFICQSVISSPMAPVNLISGAYEILVKSKI